VLRSSYYIKQIIDDNKIFDHCYDCTYFSYLIKNYLNKFKYNYQKTDDLLKIMIDIKNKLTSDNKLGGYNLSKKEIFAEKKGVIYDKLMITPEGIYSITTKRDGHQILKIIKQIIGNTHTKIITDLTGNVGGDTILFGLNFKKVYSIEYNLENYKALENNVKVFDLKNVELFYGDSTKIFNWYTDVLYVDPPWGGPNYKTHKNLDLYLGEIRIDKYIYNILNNNNRPKYIFIKVPSNYYFQRLYDIKEKIKITVQKFQIRRYNMVALY
jgi:predicted RNA methylase